MSPFALRSAIVATLFAAGTASADTIYSNFQNIPIPNTFAGVFLDIDTGVTNTTSFTGWDINPFFTGEGIANSAAFQPVRIGTGKLDRILNLAPGTLISGSLLRSSGFGGSGDPNAHIGTSADQFQSGVEGYLGFQFTKNGGLTPLYGWMGVTLSLNGLAATIKDWAYDDGGGTIVIGEVQQSAPSSGAQLVTLSPGIGETFTLGSAISNRAGNINSLLKTGAGTTTLATANPFTGTTTVSGGTLEVKVAGALSGTTGVTVGSSATLALSGTGTIDRINNAAAITLAGGTFAFAGSVTEGSSSPGTGPLVLAASSAIDFGGGNDVINFGASGAAAWASGATLSIYNWGGSPAGGGSDRLLFGSASDGTSLTTLQLAQISFYNAGPGSSFLGTGGFVGSSGELRPVPEPSGIFTGLGLLGVAALRQSRRKTRRETDQNPSSRRALGA